MVLFVCGLPRVGLSIVCQMLAAANYSVLGDFPTYEPIAAGRLPWYAFNSAYGRVVKVVDVVAMRFEWEGPQSARAIYVTRPAEDCARSALRHTVTTNQGIAQMLAAKSLNATREALATLASTYRRDEPIARDRVLKATDGDMLTLEFKQLVEEPLQAAGAILDYLHVPERVSDGRLNHEFLQKQSVMARQVRLRTPAPLASSIDFSKPGRLLTLDDPPELASTPQSAIIVP